MPAKINPWTLKLDLVEDLSGYVPYTGATTSLNMGVYDLSATDLTLLGSLDTPEIFNTLGDLKIQPDVHGDVTLFGDTDVGDVVDGKSLYIHRKAAEGDSSFRFYINQYSNANIETSGGCRLDAGGTFNFQPNSLGDATFFESSTQFTTNRNVQVSGYITAASAAKYVRLKVNDTTDNFELTREDTNIGAFDIQMPLILSAIGADTDNTVFILNSSNEVKTDEIDSRVWGATLADDTDIIQAKHYALLT